MLFPDKHASTVRAFADELATKIEPANLETIAQSLRDSLPVFVQSFSKPEGIVHFRARVEKKGLELPDIFWEKLNEHIDATEKAIAFNIGFRAVWQLEWRHSQKRQSYIADTLGIKLSPDHLLTDAIFYTFWHYFMRFKIARAVGFST